MYPVDVIRKLKKTEYDILREKVRSHIQINSKVARDKRVIFYESDKYGIINEFLIGGLVLKKQLYHSCCLFLGKDKGYNHISLDELVNESSLMKKLASIESTARILLYDFSGGVFDVSFSPPPLTFQLIKKGEVVYVIGEIGCFISRGVQSVSGVFLLNEREVESYKKGESSVLKENFYNKDYVAKIKEVNAVEGWGALVECGSSVEEKITRILKESPCVDGFDCFWIASVLYDIYLEFSSERIYNLVRKYFYKWSETQDGMESASAKEDFLRSIWPEEISMKNFSKEC